MIFSEIIKKKRDGSPLTREEIDFSIQGYTDGTIPDYQMAALLMAIVLKGMSEEETLFFTKAMLHSGKSFDLSHIPGKKVDKHSTGGVGDKVSLILAPLVASCGVLVPMVSGRGLGHTGGTLDKLESIPGFRTNLTYREFSDTMESIGVAMMGQTSQIAPADKKMYSLRDVTGTVESIPLITASILSKKLAEGIDGLVLDVKCGTGAFMKEVNDAEALARTMKEVVRGFGKKYMSLITNMDQPLGRNVGNSVEVIESIECLKGRGTQDLMEVTYALAREMLLLGEIVEDSDAAQRILEGTIGSGKALELFSKMVEKQGGDPRVVDDYSILPLAKNTEEIKADHPGYITNIDAYEVGLVTLALGGGRRTKEDSIDPGVGLVLKRRSGAWVEKGEVIAKVYFTNSFADDIRKRFVSAITIEETPVEIPSMIIGKI
jgi:pyrimidine-nucleoside phosphorylase